MVISGSLCACCSSTKERCRRLGGLCVLFQLVNLSVNIDPLDSLVYLGIMSLIRVETLAGDEVPFFYGGIS